MAATGKTPILLYGSTTTTNTPSADNLTNSTDGCEIAINVADKNLFFKDSTNAVNTVPIRQSSASSDGWLSSTDWSTFNSKQPAGSYALTSGTLAQFAPTTSAQLAGVISDETGTGSLVFNNAPTFLNNTTIYTSGASGNAYTRYYNDSKSYYVGLRGDTSNVWAIADESAFRFSVSGTGDATLYTGNLIIGTSGKGIDFSATAGTGTSELLADYEEGTYTPTVSSAAGTLTSYTSSGRYVKVGTIVMATFTATITNNGTGSAAIVVSLPFASSSATYVGSGRENAISGAMLQLLGGGTGSTCTVFTYNNGYPGGTNAQINGTFVYSV